MGIPGGSVGKNQPGMQEMQVRFRSLNREDPLEKETATQFSILARGAWWATVQGLQESDTTYRLNNNE